jgi:NIPSNAP
MLFQTFMQQKSDDARQEIQSSLAQTCCPIVELRQYTLHPGMRDDLIDLFDREFVESQEALGIRVIGQFRDLDDPQRFVWLRGFRDMPTRAEALAAFYGGPIWKTYREAANATMIDSDNVLLLRPATPQSAFLLEGKHRPSVGPSATPKVLVVATIYYFDEPVSVDFLGFFENKLKPSLKSNGASILGYFTTEESENTFLPLPIREDEQVFVWFASFDDSNAYEHYEADVVQSEVWRGRISKKLAHYVKRPFETRRLSPTTRSLLGRRIHRALT